MERDEEKDGWTKWRTPCLVGLCAMDNAARLFATFSRSISPFWTAFIKSIKRKKKGTSRYLSRNEPWRRSRGRGEYRKKSVMLYLYEEKKKKKKAAKPIFFYISVRPAGFDHHYYLLFRKSSSNYSSSVLHTSLHIHERERKPDSRSGSTSLLGTSK